MTDQIVPLPHQFLREDVVRGGMDLLYFAHRGHLQHADEELAKRGLGRAHHRVLYFVGRHPDMAVGELITVLAITKQSVARVLNQLIAQGLIESRTGDRDRRQRILRLTEAGAALELALFDDLRDNMARAFDLSGIAAVEGYWTVMQHLMGAQARTQFVKLFACGKR